MSKDIDNTNEIVKRLNVMIALALDQKEKISEKEKIEKLNAFGLNYKDVAQILGKNPVNVAVVLNKLKNKK